MPTELIRCPACGAADTSKADQAGTHRCVYCGAKYRIRGSSPQGAPITVVVADREGGGAGTVAVIVTVVAFVLIIAGGVAAYALLIPAEPGPARSAEAAPTGVRERVAADVSKRLEKSSRARQEKLKRDISKLTVKPKPDVPLSADFEFHSRISSSGSSYYVLGMVKNTSSVNIGKAKVIAVLYDEAGAEVESYRGYAEADVIEPGESSPVKVLVKDPPAHKTRRYEVVVRDVSYLPTRAPGLRVEANKPKKAQFGRMWEVKGKVFNEGDKPAEFVKVEIRAYNKDSKLIGLSFTYADGKKLLPASNARFSGMGIMLDEEPDHFEFSVSGRVAD